jgi:hypothetical protein
MTKMDWEGARRADVVAQRGGERFYGQTDPVTLSKYERKLATREIKRRALQAELAGRRHLPRIESLRREMAEIDQWLDQFEANRRADRKPN